MPGHPVDVVEGRRISFIPGFQDTDESCKALSHAPWRLSEFANLKICGWFFSEVGWLAVAKRGKAKCNSCNSQDYGIGVITMRMEIVNIRKS